ncbi:MAG: TetR/AcrR family transcriptional regulator [Clostridiales bacterium]|nr:TetR/AcrR family transcriptional regulator [Clostridiales bacterium]
MARITKHVEERRQEIIDTAREMFIESGYEKTQVADISRRMNVASGLVYHYFKSKADILYAVIDELAENKIQDTKNALDKSNGTALERLGLILAPDPNLGLYGKLVNSRAFLKYCKEKTFTAISPVFCSLIEAGNEDGSWNCEYPRETAAFILQGIAGASEMLECPPNAEQKPKVFTDIIYRILDVPPRR